jgi:hypothetical protein
MFAKTGSTGLRNYGSASAPTEDQKVLETEGNGDEKGEDDEKLRLLETHIQKGFSPPSCAPPAPAPAPDNQGTAPVDSRLLFERQQTLFGLTVALCQIAMMTMVTYLCIRLFFL